jgi:hypothetical protein
MPAPQALPSTGYRPRSATNPLKEIVDEHYEEPLRDWDERFRATYGTLHCRLKDLFEEFVRCGDPHFAACAAERDGRLRLRCLTPDYPETTERIVPSSCKSPGLCPSCGQKRAIAWAERMVEEVLPGSGSLLGRLHPTSR